MQPSQALDLPPLPLPDGIQSSYVVVNDLLVHFLDARPHLSHSGKPALIVMLHGFPELAISWRKVMRPLADRGFRVVAPDQRGFGRTVPLPGRGSDVYPYTYEHSLDSFRLVNLVRDIASFVFALGYDHVACIVGHDFGSIVSGHCTLVRPDVFRKLFMMSSPYFGAPTVPMGVPTYATLGEAVQAAQLQATQEHPGITQDKINASLNPPRMHYQHYFSLPQADIQMHKELNMPQLQAFFRAYFHIKSACWPYPYPPRTIQSWTQDEINYLPPYYLMPRGKTMPEIAHDYAPEGADLERSRAWLSDEEVAVYASEYGRTGFQGGLNRYRIATGLGRIGDSLQSISLANKDYMHEFALFAQKKIEVPAMFVAGDMDWNPYQYPLAQDRMRIVCPLMREGPDGICFIKGAGHWVQQEKPNEVVQKLLNFVTR